MFKMKPLKGGQPLDKWPIPNVSFVRRFYYKSFLIISQVALIVLLVCIFVFTGGLLRSNTNTVCTVRLVEWV